MCGRFARFSDVHQMLGPLGVQWQGDLLPNYNTAPSQQVLAVRQQDGRREAVQLRWGLIPFWAKDKSIGYRMINARADGIADKPAFRQPFRQQRCLIPADGFYEWRHDGGRKQPYYIHRKDNQPLVFAGLWSRWEDRENREIIESCTIITGEPNELVAQIHNRMPVILDPAGCDEWLESDDRASLERLLSPIPAQLLAAHPVSTAVNKPSQGGPGLIEPLRD